ncbi:MAG: hypothetical protein F6K42_39535, partial [Leptolyngbya sp. SIO1D8]|nr:hypothetical protein [Leptolyngbya sp. SIO1D8]
RGFITLSELPPGMPLTEAYLFLDAEGSCKLNGVDVPVLFAADLPKPVVPEVEAQASTTLPEATPQTSEEPLPWGLLIGAVTVLGGVGWLVYALYGKKPTTSQKTLTNTNSGQPSALSTLMAQLKDGEGEGS